MYHFVPDEAFVIEHVEDGQGAWPGFEYGGITAHEDILL
jgi:hypothetical protein